MGKINNNFQQNTSFSHQLRQTKVHDQLEALLLMPGFNTMAMDHLLSIQELLSIQTPDLRLVPLFPSPAVLGGQGRRACDALGELKSQLCLRQLAVPQRTTPDITHLAMEGKNGMISHHFSAFGFPTTPLSACWATGSLCAPEEGRMVPDKAS